jgi:hypothetical protein
MGVTKTGRASTRADRMGNPYGSTVFWTRRLRQTPNTPVRPALMKCPVTVDRLQQLISGENSSCAVCAPGDE